MPTTFNMSDVMISYSRRDKTFVQQLTQSLKNSGRNVWIDWEDIPPTAAWWSEIEAGINAAHTFVFVITPNSIRSSICDQEIDHATRNNKRIVPILREEITDELDKQRMHVALQTHNWILFREGDDFNESFRNLVKALETDLVYAQIHTRLLVRAQEWDTKNRKGSLLLRGDDLREAENWLTRSINSNPPPIALQADYISASRRAAMRFRQIVAALTTSLMVILSLLAIFAFNQSTLANTALEDSNERGTQVAFQIMTANALLTQVQDREIQRAAAQQSADDNQQLADTNATLSADNAATANSNATLSGYSALTATSAQSTAGAAQDQAKNSLLTATAAQGQVGDVALTATNAQGQAYDNLLTATFAQGEGQNALLTAQAAQNQANIQATQAAVNQAAANAASTLAAQQQAAARQAQQEAANAQASAIAAQNEAAIARANAATQQAKANAAATEVSIALTDAANAKGDAVNAKATAAAALTAAATAIAEATEALGTAVAAQATAEFQREQAQSLSLASFALSENVNNNRPLAMELALLSVITSSDLENIPETSKDILRRISYGMGLRVVSNIQSTVTSLVLSSDGKHALSGDTNGLIRLWNIDLASPDFSKWITLATLTGEIEDLVLTQNGMLVVASENYSLSQHTLSFYQLNNATPKSLTLLKTLNPTFASAILAISNDGKYLASGFDSKFRLLDISNLNSPDLANPIVTMFPHPYCEFVCRVVDMSFLDDSTNLLVAYNNTHPVYPSGQTNVYDITLDDSNGNLGVIRSYHLSNIYGANTVDPLFITSATIHNDTLLEGIETGIVAWKNGESDISSRLSGHTGNVNMIAIVGNRAISGSSDATVRLWDIPTNTQIGPTLVGHTGWVYSVVMNGDTSIAMSGSGDGTIRFWDIKTGQELNAPTIPVDPKKITTDMLKALVNWTCSNRSWQAGIVASNNPYGVTQPMLDRLHALKDNNCDITRLPPLETKALTLFDAVPMTPTYVFPSTPVVAFTPTDPPTPDITLTPSITPTYDPNLPLIIDSSDVQVSLNGGWLPVENPQANGGSYLISSTADDTMGLIFEGTAISIIYFQHPAMGTFNVEIDGTLIGSVRETGNTTVFRQVPISGLTPGLHTIRLVPAQNPVVIDAFVVNPPINWLPGTIVTATPPPTLEVILTPTASLTPGSTPEIALDTLTPSPIVVPTETLETWTPTPTYIEITETFTPTATLTDEATWTPTLETPIWTDTPTPVWTTTETATANYTDTPIPISTLEETSG